MRQRHIFFRSKRQKIEQEVQNVEQLLPSRLLEEHLDTEADAETTPSNESRALDDLEPINQDVLMLEKPTEDDKIQSEIKQVGANNNEVQGGDAVVYNLLKIKFCN